MIQPESRVVRVAGHLDGLAQCGGAAGGEVAWSRLRHLLRPIMWRSTKLDVASELHLPSCSVEVGPLG